MMKHAESHMLQGNKGWLCRAVRSAKRITTVFIEKEKE